MQLVLERRFSKFLNVKLLLESLEKMVWRRTHWIWSFEGRNQVNLLNFTCWIFIFQFNFFFFSFFSSLDMETLLLDVDIQGHNWLLINWESLVICCWLILSINWHLELFLGFDWESLVINCCWLILSNNWCFRIVLGLCFFLFHLIQAHWFKLLEKLG